MNSGGFMGGQIHPAAVQALASRKRKILDQVKNSSTHTKKKFMPLKLYVTLLGCETVSLNVT